LLKENEKDENPALYFIIKGEVELYHNKSIRTKEYINLKTLTVNEEDFFALIFCF